LVEAATGTLYHLDLHHIEAANKLKAALANVNGTGDDNG